MKRRLIISTGLLCLMAGVASSCWFNKSDVFLRSMVSAYGMPKELNINRAWAEGFIFIDMTISAGDIVTYYSTGEEKILYDEWCQKHGDMSYDREVRVRTGDHLPHEFIAADYAAMEIVSDADWDAEHPAGTSLGDIAMFYSASPIKYIRSGYSKKYDWSDTAMPEYFYSHMENSSLAYFGNGIAKGKTPFYPVVKLVSELKSEDMVLLGCGVMGYGSNKSDGGAGIGFVEFTTRPTAAKEHNITVTLTTDEGEVFSDTIQMTFN